MTRHLVVNADDFGQSAAINAGVAAAHERGIVTSASLTVRWPAAADAAAYAAQHPRLGLGLHFDLGEWRSTNGAWEPRYEVVRVEDADAVAGEVARQLEAFRALAGRDPTHLDSHQHVHVRHSAVRRAVLGVATAIGVPVRRLTEGIEYRGEFYGQDDEGAPLPEAISVGGLVEILRDLRPGISELGCHPALAVDLDTTYAAERERELATLCDPAARRALDAEGIRLTSFRGWRGRS